MAEGEKLIATNRKARHEYRIEETLEAGLELTGTEVKSLRAGGVNLKDAYCTEIGDEFVLLQCHIAPYNFGNRQNHDPLRPRKLLMHRKEIHRWKKSIQQKGFTVIPLRMYFRRGFAKVELGLARGKNLYDKRSDIATRETRRRLERAERRDH
jgi:SsrA-binding protein